MDSYLSSSPTSIAAILIAPMLPLLHSLHREAQLTNTDEDELASFFNTALLCEEGAIRYPNDSDDDSEDDEIANAENPQITDISKTETHTNDVLSHLNTLRLCEEGRIHHHPVADSSDDELANVNVPDDRSSFETSEDAEEDLAFLEDHDLCERGESVVFREE